MFSGYKFDEGAFRDGVESQGIHNGGLHCSFGCVAVIFHLGGFVFILENGHDGFASLLAHVGYAALYLLVDIFLLPQIK